MSPYALPLLGRLAWIDIIILGWFVLVLASVSYVAEDAFRKLPEPGVIKWAWVLTTLYLGPVGAAFYILTDKEPRPGEHERFVAPMWKQALGSTLHCVAGDATGVIIAATITGLLGLPMWVDMSVEYIFGFAFGLDGPMGKTGYKGFGIALTSDEIDRKTGFDQPFTVTSAEVTGHVVQPIGDLVLGARVGAAYDVFRSKRQIVIDPDLDVTGITRAPKADWNGAHISAALHAAYPTHLGFVSVRPEVGIDAVSMWEQEYEEKGGGAGLNLAIDSRQTTRANASATVAFGLPFQRRGFAFTPEVTLGVRAPLLKDPYDLSGHFVSATSQQFTLASESYDSPAAIAGLALNVEGPIGSFRLEGQAEQSDGETPATGRLVLRLTF